MDLGNGRGHLAYSTLVHAGDTWAEMRDSVRTHLPAVKAAVSPDQPFGVSLRLSAASAATLAEDEGERRRFREFLDAEGLYVYTVNAFPYGPFKGRQVKEQVYEPDWSTEDRTAYTMRVADVLVDISPEGVSPSIQTAPLAFRPNVVDDAYLAACTRNVLRVVAHLATIERETGRRIKLAIEPEPYCYLETTDETVAYFSEQLYSAAGVHLLLGAGRSARLGGHGSPATAPRAWCSTSVTRLSGSRTSRARWRSSSRPAFPSSSCRKRRPCGFRAWTPTSLRPCVPSPTRST